MHREQTDASDPNQQSYEAWLADQAGSLRRIGTSAPVQATPLPLVRAQTTGVLIERPRHNRQVDPAVAGLFDSTPLLLLALPREYRGDTDGILALSLDAMPHDGEVALALVLVRRAAMAMTLSGAPGDDHMLPWGGRTACRWADDLHASARSRELSPREREVVHLVAAGLRNKEIARRLHISEKTVKFHLGRIFDKLAVDSRTEVVRRAIGTGLVSPEEMV